MVAVLWMCRWFVTALANSIQLIAVNGTANCLAYRQKIEGIFFEIEEQHEISLREQYDYGSCQH